MILTRFIRAQLIVLTVASMLGAVVLGAVFLRLPENLKIGHYDLTAQFADAGRLYEGAEVNYRGYAVGRVREVRLSDSGVEAVLRIESAIEVPRTSRAEVHSLSAVGEQYVDLLPTDVAGPYFADGDVIPPTQTSVPVQIGPVLDQVDRLVAALPADDLNTVVDETFTAFRGAGADLQRIITNARTLVTLATDHFPQTEALINDAEPLLSTLNGISPEIRSLTVDLADLTEQLRESDPSIRSLLIDGQPFARELDGLLEDLEGPLPTLLANLVTVGGVLDTYRPNLEQILVVYPALAAAGQSAALPNGADAKVNTDLDAAVNDPPPCLEGFVPAEQWRDPADTSPAPAPDAYCRLPRDDASSVRGARNTPCANAPGVRAATPAICRGEPAGLSRRGNSPIPEGSPLAPVVDVLSPERPDPLGGAVLGPDGTPFYMRNVGSPAQPKESQTWQSLLLGPLGG